MAKIPSPIRNKIETFVFEELPQLQSVYESKRIEQLRGYSAFHKIRFGDYRVGLMYENDRVIFERALHRRDIYRYFP